MKTAIWFAVLFLGAIAVFLLRIGNLIDLALRFEGAYK